MPLDLTKLKVFPLSQRVSDARLSDILVDPDSQPAVAQENSSRIAECAKQIKAARQKNASVMLIYGAHLIKNGAAKIVIRLMEQGWITHVATNGAGVIHDWEFSFAGVSTESVQKNVATGTFGTWDETGRNINLAVLTGAIEALGFGSSVGKFTSENGAVIPTADALENLIKSEPRHPLTPARAELLQAILTHRLSPGRYEIKHPHKNTSVLGESFRLGIPFTVHPGIGYDIISNHPMFNGSALGRAAGIDFRVFGETVEKLDGGVVLSVGSAIMGPQVFEKSISCVNNLRVQAKRPIVHDHNIYVVDLQDGGNWDWTKGEPPKTNPAYYLRFCKSYSRMGGNMHYLQSDNLAFLHNLLHALQRNQQ
jgi:hypothetical protein